MKLLLTAICPTLFVLFATAQHNEFIVFKNSDTLFGNITYRNNIFTVKTVKNETVHHASFVKKVSFSKFKGRVIFYKLYTHNANLQDIGYFNYESVYKDTTLFLKEIYLTKKMNLYSAKDSYKTEYYFVDKPADSMPTQLKVSYRVKSDYRDEILGIRNNDYMRTNLIQEKLYVGQLRILMSDCRKISNSDFEALDYQSYKFKKLIKNYNRACK